MSEPILIDTHVHVISGDRKKYPRTADTERAGQVKTVAEMGQPEWPIVTGESLLADMDRAGVAKALLVQAYYTYEFDNSYAIDTALAHPERFRSVVVLDPMAPESPDRLSDLVENRGVAGLRLSHGHQGASTLDNPATFPLWERAAELGVSVCIGDRLKNYTLLRTVLERFPSVAVPLDHIWGNTVGDPPYDMLKPLFDLAAYPNVYVKTAINNSRAAREGKSTPEVFFRTLIDHFGADRIMWGSNYPAHPGKYGGLEERVTMSRADYAFLTPAERNAMFGGTALKIYPQLSGATATV